MKIAVAIPVYNAEKYIERALRSYFSQTIASQVRYVLVNDCPTDNTVEIEDRVVAEFPDLDITVMNHPCNKGLAAARNTALEYLETTDADYVMNLDSDDYAEPDMIERMAAAAQENDADMVWCNYNEINADGTKCIKYEEPKDKDGHIAGFLVETLPSYLWCKLTRLSLFKDNHLRWIPGADIWEDKMMTIKLAWYSKRIVHLPAAFYHYDRTNAGSILHTSNLLREGVDTNILEMCDFLKRMGAADKFRKEIGIAKLLIKRPLFSVDADLWRTRYEDANRYIINFNVPLTYKVKYLCMASNIPFVRNMMKLLIKKLKPHRKA